MVEQTTADKLKDSQSFDTVASLYNQYRPEYPQELVDSVINLSGLPEDGRILEIGCGTGKATRLFACRGYTIHCVEPGSNLVALAAQNLHSYPRVTFEIARFEQSQEWQEEFNLVISAQAFHWVSKETGYAKAARALKPGGSIALFWNMHPGFNGQIAADLDKIYRELAPGMDNPNTYTEQTIQKGLEDINQSGCFGPITIRRFPWSRIYHTKEYLGLINTFSDHLRLSEQTRLRLFNAIGYAIDAQGGMVQRDYVAVLYVAQKNP